MIARARRTAFAGLLSLGATACRTAPRPPEPAIAAEAFWSSTLAMAGQEVAQRRYLAADSLFSKYAVRFPARGEAVESIFWRALYKLDPANPSVSAREAGALLDAYLAVPTAERRSEAAVLRRTAASMDARSASGPATPQTRDEVARGSDKARDDELARVRDELAKANSELERIKRRLAQPKP